jgi:uncharacterized protein YecE (DUF72 family)
MIKPVFCEFGVLRNWGLYRRQTFHIFSYIRWLGNRKDIEKLTTTWNSTIIDRTADLQTWVDVCEKIQKRGITQYVYANNHYSGFAPATVELFRSLCKARGIETPLNVQLPEVIEPKLFDISPN